jgi:hypothetical protein
MLSTLETQHDQLPHILIITEVKQRRVHNWVPPRLEAVPRLCWSRRWETSAAQTKHTKSGKKQVQGRSVAGRTATKTG